MSESNGDGPAPRVIAGIPPSLVGPVVSILESSTGPIRRRKILEELERHGHRVSLAGLNRILQHFRETGRTVESPEGVRLRR